MAYDGPNEVLRRLDQAGTAAWKAAGNDTRSSQGRGLHNAKKVNQGGDPGADEHHVPGAGELVRVRAPAAVFPRTEKKGHLTIHWKSPDHVEVVFSPFFSQDIREEIKAFHEIMLYEGFESTVWHDIEAQLNHHRYRRPTKAEAGLGLPQAEKSLLAPTGDAGGPFDRSTHQVKVWDSPEGAFHPVITDMYRLQPATHSRVTDGLLEISCPSLAGEPTIWVRHLTWEEVNVLLQIDALRGVTREVNYNPNTGKPRPMKQADKPIDLELLP